MHKLEENIKSTVTFSRPVTGTGFYPLKCPVCQDRKVRAGFKFESDKIVYSCFRGKCPIQSAVYVYGEPMYNKFKTVLKALNVEIPIDVMLVKKNIATSVENALNLDLYDEHHYKDIELPPDFIKYDPAVHHQYRRYLEHERGLFDTNYYIGVSNEWKNKLIIPFYFHNTLIGWQGFDIYTEKYLKSSGNTDLIYCPTGYMPKVPIIVEGVFDAKAIPNGVAVLQSTLTKKQAFHFKDTSPILLPDRKGSRFLDIMKRYQWKICIPEWKEKDVDEAKRKYGLLIIAQMIYNGIVTSETSAEVKYKMWRIK